MTPNPNPAEPNDTGPNDTGPNDTGTARQPRLVDRHLALCVTGSIAAYKAAALARLLVTEGALVSVIMSKSARELIGAATFSGITGGAVHTEMFVDQGGELHVALARNADAVVVFPATADSLARFAQGRADDLIAALLLCSQKPVLIAPAMHPFMWAHPATQRNVHTLQQDGRVQLVGPVHGEVASGDTGMGRMVEPETMLGAIKNALTEKDLKGRHVVVTSGPTVEDIDPVRFVSNRSSGKMGFALAERAAWRGAQVTLITGPVSLPTPAGVQRIDVRSAEELSQHLGQALGPSLSQADVLIMAAAVSDYRPRVKHAVKQKRREPTVQLELEATPDLLADIGARRKAQHPVLVGFAVETGSDDEIASWARNKLAQKHLDLIVANPSAESFGRDDNRAQLITNKHSERLPRLHKGDLAERILDQVYALLSDG